MVAMNVVDQLPHHPTKWVTRHKFHVNITSNMKTAKNYWYLSFVLLIPLLFFSAENALSTLSNNEAQNKGIADAELLEANIAKILIKPAKGEPVLENYPFPLLNPPVTIAEGFDSYDGNLKDKPGSPHLAIDYVQKFGESYQSFPVFSAHSGSAIQGYGKTWGKFVIIRSGVNNRFNKNGESPDFTFNTLYSHLINVPDYIPFIKSDINEEGGIDIESATHIGDAGTTGTTNGIPQLHFEMHEVNTKTKETFRIDPYGIYARLSSGKYPKIGDSLKNLPHYWKSDTPDFPAW